YISSLKEKIIPFFKKFNFISSRKKTNFSIFKDIVEQMFNGEHLNKEGFQRIIQLRESLNEGKGRKRKYVLSDVIKAEESPETTRKILQDNNGKSTVEEVKI
ncbi:MAG: hypothetical protein QG568_44, partial [Patescibacteria group bacterium]|nr:hypothetical protein [Patescibacteria group bacterium]